MSDITNGFDFDLEIELLEGENKLPDNMFIDEDGVRLLIEGLTIDSYNVAVKILDVSQENVPVDEGFLKSRGRVEKTPDGYMIIYDTDYAIYVHNNTAVKHTIGSALFLSDAYYKVLSSDLDLGGGIGD